MVASVRGHFGLQGGTTALTMVPPVGSAVGDKGVIYTVDKNSTVDPTDPGSGWLRLGSAQLGLAPDGVGTGKIRFTAWEQDYSATPVNVPIPFPLANRALGGGTVFQKDATDVWAASLITFGEDIVSDTTFAALMAANLGMRVGDFLLSFGAFTDTVSLLGRGITIPGITSAITNVNSAGGVVGNKIFVWTDYRQATAGAQSGAATTNATAGTATTGGAVQIQVGLASLGLPLGAAAETDAAQQLVLAKALQLGAAGSTEVAKALTFTKQLLLGVPTDLSTAPPLALLKALGLGVATEIDAARTLTSSKLLTLGRAQEADTARPVDMGIPAVDYTPARTPIASTRAGDRTAGTRTVRYTAATRTVASSASTREG